MAAQVLKLDKGTPGGLVDYVMRGRKFLNDSKNGINPFDNFKPEVPTGQNLIPASPEMDDFEKIGMAELPQLCLVIIAGGLGERLGYSGIKVDLPLMTIEDDYCYLKFYFEYAIAIRERCLDMLDASVDKENFYVPIFIQVSDDTEAKTMDLLNSKNYFNYKKEWVDMVKQENVPALIDNSGSIAFDQTTFKITTKPHGHGDIHTLLYQSGVAKKWEDMGKKWMLFI